MSVQLPIVVTDAKTGEIVARFRVSGDAAVFAEASTANEHDDRELRINDRTGHVNAYASDGIVVYH